MKTAQQMIERLEKVVDSLNGLTASWGQDYKPNEEEVGQLSVLIGGIFFLGWALDCEDELRQVFAQFKLAAVLQKIEGKL